MEKMTAIIAIGDLLEYNMSLNSPSNILPAIAPLSKVVDIFAIY
jgi:hypothetical protein